MRVKSAAGLLVLMALVVLSTSTQAAQRAAFVSGVWTSEAGQEIGGSLRAPTAIDFEMTTDDNALITNFWGTAEFTTIVVNSGTQNDTLDLVIDNSNLPFAWDGVFCIGPICYTEKDIYLEAGQSETVEVHIAAGGALEVGVASLTATSRGNPGLIRTEHYGTFVHTHEVLMVDDDNGAGHETHMATALSDAGYPAWIWDADALGRPSVALLSSVWAVFWTTADGDATYITSDDEGAITGYLDAGGNLFMASMDYLSSRTGTPAFVSDYLHVTSHVSNTGGSPVTGVVGDPISDGMSFDLTGGPFSAGNSDDMILSAPSDEIFLAGGASKGLKVEEDSHKLVFLAFPFEDVSTTQPDPNNQQTLIERVTDWFGPMVGIDDESPIAGAKLSLKQNYPNPFNPATLISFIVPRKSDHIEVAVYDARGRLVRTLVRGVATAGEHSVTWDGRNDAGAEAASGVYFCKLSTERESALKKMALLK